MSSPLIETTALLGRLRDRGRLAVLYGAAAIEGETVLRRTMNPRPWKSYEAVARQLAETLRGLGFWATVMAEGPDLGRRLRDERVDLVWLNSGGVQGFDPTSQANGALEALGIPYIGHRPAAQALLDHKHYLKLAVRGLGLPTAPWALWRPGVALPLELPGPWIVKPLTGRGSLHVLEARTPVALAEASAEVHRATGGAVLVESFLPGREFTVAVAGGTEAREGGLRLSAEPRVFSRMERMLEGKAVFRSMDEAPVGARVRRLDDDRVRAPLDLLATRLFTGLDLHHIVRIDLREDSEGQLFVLEVNPKPDLSLSPPGLVTAPLEAEGWTFDELVLSLLAHRLRVMVEQHAPLHESLTRRLRAGL